MKLSELFEDAPTKWVIGSLGSNGLMLKSQGLTIKMDSKDTDALVAALKAKDEVVIKTTDNKMFRFEPFKDGFTVTPEDDDENIQEILQPDIEHILDVADNDVSLNTPSQPTTPSDEV